MRVGALARVEGVQGDCRPAPVVQGVTEGESRAGTVAPSVGTLRVVVLNSFGVRADGREIRLWIPFDAGFASSEGDPRLVVHETGHLLGLPDLYTANAPSTLHRWDVMAARWPSELLAWHRWKLGWLDPDQIVCITRRSTRTVTLQPLERPGGTKAVVVKRGLRAIVVEVRARSGYDSTLCDTGVLAYEVDQTPFKRAPVRVFPARPERDAPERGCSALWNAPFDLARGETAELNLPSIGFRLELLAKGTDGSYRIRVTSSVPTP